MATFVDFNLTFTDNSSGVRDEDGTEVQIYTDSPSFVPNIVVDYAHAPHPWMSLPLVGAAISTIPIKLETPVSFVKVRVRQFNENGQGDWGLATGTTFTFGVGALTNAPNSPSNVGLLAVATPTPPQPPPVDPPPTPVPPGSGTTTNYTMPGQYSGVQGQSGWSYKDSSGADLTYSAVTGLWTHASQIYLGAWAGGGHPGTTYGLMERWTVPESGTVTVTGNFNLYETPGGGKGVTFTIKHNSTTKFTQAATDPTVYQFVDQIASSFAVTAGDTLDFILTANQADISFNSTQFTINIALVGGGGTPTNPLVANISPSTLSASVGTVNSMRVNLSSAALVDSTVALSSTNGAIASVPATVTVVAGQSSALFDITAVAAGTATITATYNSSSATCATTITTPAPGGGLWVNQPSGMTLVADTPFTNSVPSPWYNVYSTLPFASPGGSGASFSPPVALDVTLAAFSTQGNGEWGINFAASSEVYLGFYWSTNSAFQGNFHSSNKMIFIRNQANDNNFLQWYGPQDSPKYLQWAMQASTYLNLHVSGWQGDGVSGSGAFNPNINGSAATLSAGSGWHFVEVYLKKSTGSNTRDGIMKLWVNGVLTSSYTNINQTPSGFNNLAIATTWDGSEAYTATRRDMTRSWHHYFDHIYFSRKA